MRVLFPLYTTVHVSYTTVHVAGRGTDVLFGGTPATCVSLYHCMLLYVSCILLYMCPTLCTTVHVAGGGTDILLGATPLHVSSWPLYTYTTVYVSSCCCVLVRILVHVCPHTTVCVFSYCYVCVLMLLCMFLMLQQEAYARVCSMRTRIG